MSIEQIFQGEFAEGHLEVSDKLISEFEKEFGGPLPIEYKDFLKKYGSSFVSASINIEEPNPFGGGTIVDFFYGFNKDKESYDIRDQNEMAQASPFAVPIAGNLFGGQFLMLCQGEDAGKVLFFDIEQRALWPDEQFYEMFENLSPEIETYLEQRRNGEIPEKEEGYESFYLVGSSLDDFLEKLEKVDYDE